MSACPRRLSEKLWNKIPRKHPTTYSLREAARMVELVVEEGKNLMGVFKMSPPKSKVA